MVLIRFWRSQTKKDSVDSAKYEIQFFSTFSLVLGRFFTDTGFGFFWICSGFMADPDPDSGRKKKSDPAPGKKNQIQNIGY